MACPSASHAPAPVPCEELVLWNEWRASRSSAARNALLLLHLPYAQVVAATYYARRRHDEIEFAEYLQHARVGLLEAFERYDPEAGAQFRTFAARRMHGAILDGIERFSEKQQQIAIRERLRREAIGAAEGASLDTSASPGHEPSRLFQCLIGVGMGVAVCALLEGTGMVDADVAFGSAERDAQPLEHAQLRRRIHDLVDGLNPQQRSVIRYHYLQDHSFAELANLLGLTRGRISQIHCQALILLRALLLEDEAVETLR